ncbi:MAG: MFS transporter [Actinobacteria bacterium]|jgi:EmrB/QacA subfamily drug resistance transporter|nr:MFS transporter [Actinomycetota bacterium]
MRQISRPTSFFDTNAAASLRPAYVLLANFLAAWTAAFTTTSINIALPSIQTEFHLGAMALGWLTLGYVLASAVLLLPLGKVGDRYGRRLLYLGGFVLFALSSVATVFADSFTSLLILRITQGIGASAMFCTAMAVLTLAYPPQRRGFAMGVSAAAAYLGQTMGPVLGGVIVHNVGWRNLFLVTGCFAFFIIGLDLWLLGRAEWKEERHGGYDWPGSVLYAIGLSIFLLGLSWLPLLQGVVTLAVGLLFLAVFIWWQTRARSPLIVLRLFRNNRVFAFSNLTALLSYSSVWAVTFLMSLYLQFIKGLNAQTAGLVLVVGVALQSAISPFGGRLSDRIEPRWVASIGMALQVASLLLFSFVGATTPYWYIALALALLGIGYGFFSGPNQNSIMGSVERQYVGFASAGIGTVRSVGMALSIAVATLIMALVVGRHDIQTADYPALLTAVRLTFAILTVLCAAGVATSLVRGKMPAHPAPVEAQKKV